MNSLGFGFEYPMLMSLFIYAGSMEFMTANLLVGAFDPLSALAMTLMINARHIFFGISMLDKYKGTGWKKFYLIYTLCDESFSLNYTLQAPQGVDKGWFMFFISALNHFYWVSGSTLGGLFGSLLHFDTEGLDFVLTAMFVVIFVEQWRKESSHASSLLGIAVPLACLVIFGADAFLIPAMLALLAALALLRPLLEKGGEAA